jgi:hypothetical protein
MELLAFALTLAALGALAIRYGSDTRDFGPSSFHKN